MSEASKHVLLVEDEAPLRQAIAEQLTDRGYQVEQADSGEAAVARLSEFAFDIIITDLRLPGLDGSHVLEAAVKRYPDIIAIVVTGLGTGKEVAARAIHEASPRRPQRFVALNCSAIPESLLEAEIFGHVRGAFTGAVASRPGRLEQAHKGTLFLDEVGTMTAALQMKLLRVLQEREFERIGDTHTVKVDVRVIAATNSDLTRLVAEGQFREDLYYRLNVIPIHLPPLRDRKEDIPLLVQHVFDKIAADRAARDGHIPAGPPMTVSQEAMRRLMAYHWPG